MKKRFLLPGLGAAALVSITAIGMAANNSNVSQCNKGDEVACNKLVDLPFPENYRDRISNPYFAEKLELKAEAKVKAEAEQVRLDAAEKVRNEKAKAEANKWKPVGNNVTMLAFACGQKNIKPFLKDPNSFRELKTGMSELTDTHVTVWVNYTATNSFGGRVQNTQTCRYTR